MKKTIICFLSVAVCLLAAMGILTYLMANCLHLPEETSKNITETLSSLLGSFYVAFLLGSIRDKDRAGKETKTRKKTYAAYGLILFAARTAGRIFLFLLDRAGIRGTGVILCALLEIAALVFIWCRIPAKQEGGAVHE